MKSTRRVVGVEVTWTALKKTSSTTGMPIVSSSVSPRRIVIATSARVWAHHGLTARPPPRRRAPGSAPRAWPGCAGRRASTPAVARNDVRAATRSGVGATAQRRRRGPSRVTGAPRRPPRATGSTGAATSTIISGSPASSSSVPSATARPRCTMHEAVGRALGLDELVRRDQQRAPAVALLGQQPAHDLAPLGVHAGRGLVEHEHAGPSHQGQREQRALLLAAAEAAPRRRRAPAEVERLDELGGVARRVVVAGGEAQHLARRHRRPHPAALEQRAGARRDLGVVAPRVEPVQAHGPSRRRPEAQQGLDEGRLARAVGSEQGDDLAVVDAQRHVLDRHDGTELDTQAVDFDGVTHDPRTYRLTRSLEGPSVGWVA